MSDPCPGLSVHMCELTGDGPPAKMLPKTIDIHNYSVIYTVQAAPGVELGIIIKIKEDFDFLGKEGVCITITVSDDGKRADGPLAPESLQTQSWYVDALSKWRGSQVFHAFDKAATSFSPAYKQKFIMPHPGPPGNSLARVPQVSVCVSRVTLIQGTLPSHAQIESNPEEFHHMRQRSTKQQITSTQIKPEPRSNCLGYWPTSSIRYDFYNVEPVDVAAKDAMLTQFAAGKDGEHRGLISKTTPRKGVDTKACYIGPSDRPMKKTRVVAGRSSRAASHRWKDSDQIGEYERSLDELNRWLAATNIKTEKIEKIEHEADTKEGLEQTQGQKEVRMFNVHEGKGQNVYNNNNMALSIDTAAETDEGEDDSDDYIFVDEPILNKSQPSGCVCS